MLGPPAPRVSQKNTLFEWLVKCAEDFFCEISFARFSWKSKDENRQTILWNFALGTSAHELYVGRLFQHTQVASAPSPLMQTPKELQNIFGVATPAEPHGENKLFFVQILGGEKLVKFFEKCR